VRNTRVVAAVAACVLAWVVAPAAAAPNAMPYRWQNCKHVNAKYHHGVGKLRAHDRTTGTPVTNFLRSTRLYTIAMSYNRGLDRDKDGIACEKQ
jgi:hypothetical protein